MNTLGWSKPRYLVVALAGLLGFFLFQWGMDQNRALGVQLLLLAAGFVILVGGAVYLFRDQASSVDDAIEIQDPGFVRFLFNSSRSAPLWLGIRLYLGYEWFQAGHEKFGQDAWMNGGVALKGFWTNAVKTDGPHPAVTYEVWRSYLQYMLDHEWYTWFSKIVVFGEMAIGIGLILGALTGFAAFFGAFMNMSFMLSGSASTNPVLFFLSILIILAWKTAGLIGVDAWLLPRVGVPWRSGRKQTKAPIYHAPAGAPVR